MTEFDIVEGGDYDEEETFICPYCNAEIPMEEEIIHFQEKHMDILEGRTKETLSDSEKLNLIKFATIAAEEELHKKYGYKIPKSKESLSKMSPEDEEKLWQIRDAMQRYTRVRLGLEPYVEGSWYVAPAEKIDLKDYKIGHDVFDTQVDSIEEAQALKDALKDKTEWTRSELERLIKDPKSFIPKKTREKLSLKKDPYLKRAVELGQKFLEIWNKEERGDIPGSGRNFDEQLLLSYGQQLFHHFQCPFENCGYSLRGKSELSVDEKYRQLMKHFMGHLQKLAGKATFARVVGEQKGSEAPFKPKDLPHHAKFWSPNPESCSKENLSRTSEEQRLPTVAERRAKFGQLSSDKTPKKKGDKALAKILAKSKKAKPEELSKAKEPSEKEKLFLKLLEESSSEAKRKRLLKEDKEE